MGGPTAPGHGTITSPSPVTRHIPQIEASIIAFMEGPAIPTITAEEARNTRQALRDPLQQVVGQSVQAAPLQQAQPMQQGVTNEMLRDLVVQTLASQSPQNQKCIQNFLLIEEISAEKIVPACP